MMCKLATLVQGVLAVDSKAIRANPFVASLPSLVNLNLFEHHQNPGTTRYLTHIDPAILVDDVPVDHR